MAFDALGAEPPPDEMDADWDLDGQPGEDPDWDQDTDQAWSQEGAVDTSLQNERDGLEGSKLEQEPSKGMEFARTIPPTAEPSVPVVLEIGQCDIELETLQSLSEGFIFQPDTRLDHPVTIRVFGQRIARGELICIDHRLAVRLTEVKQ